MADLDIEALEKQLQELREKRAQTRDRLDATRGGRGRGRIPLGMGGRGRGEPQRPGVFSRLGSGGFQGPRDASAAVDGTAANSRPTVFDRLYGRNAGSDPGGRDREWDREGSRDRHPHSHSTGGSGREDIDSSKGRDASPTAADEPNSRRPISSRLSSRVVVDNIENRPSERNGIAMRLGNSSREDSKQQEDSGQATAAAIPSRKRLLSAVVVNGEARTISAPLDAPPAAAAEAEEPPAKRPSIKLDDRGKRRVQRIFGVALQGTLKKAKDENAAFRASEAAQRREELARRAEEKKEAEATKAREEAAAARRAERDQQINELMDINLKSDITVLELLYAKRLKRKQELLSFCVTKTEPALYWAPREPSDESQAQLQQHAADFETWKQQQLGQLEQDKADLIARAAAKRELAAQRATQGAVQQQPQEEEQQAVDEQEEGEEGATAAEGDEEMHDTDAAAGTAAESEGVDVGAQQNEEQVDVRHDHEQEEAVESEEAADLLSRRARRRPLGSEEEEEEERLLSSDDEDE